MELVRYDTAIQICDEIYYRVTDRISNTILCTIENDPKSMLSRGSIRNVNSLYNTIFAEYQSKKNEYIHSITENYLKYYKREIGYFKYTCRKYKIKLRFFNQTLALRARHFMK